LFLENHIKWTLPENFHPRKCDAISDWDILLSQIGLLCNGRNDFNDIDLYRGDELFTNAFGIKTVASEPVFRGSATLCPEVLFRFGLIFIGSIKGWEKRCVPDLSAEALAKEDAVNFLMFGNSMISLCAYAHKVIVNEP